VLFRAVDDPTGPDRAACPHRCPGREPNKSDCPTAEVGINPKEHGYADFVLAFRDLDVVESVHDALNELDPQGPIVATDVDPVPGNRSRVPHGLVGGRRMFAERLRQKRVGLILRDSAHTQSSTNRLAERQRARTDA
jgi:hypothetical protein